MISDFAKLCAYGFSLDTLTFFYSYVEISLSVKVGNVHSVFQTIFSGNPQGSILGPILSNRFINYIYASISKSNFKVNFAHNNIISAIENTIEKLICTLDT